MKLIVLAAILSTATSSQDQQQSIPNDLKLLESKQVIVGRLPLCEPKTFTVNLNYAGKNATVVSAKPGKTFKFPARALDRLTPEMRAQLEDTQNAATLLLQFEDGKQLDTCSAIGPKRLSENMDLAPGQSLTPVSASQSVSPSPASPVSTAADSTPPSASAPAAQECPVMVTKVTSGDGGFGHALAEGLTTSEFQRQLDTTTHGGHGKHYLDMRMRNNSSKSIAAIESVVVYANKMGDETTRDTLISQNTKPIKPGDEHKSYSMDRTERTQNGAGQVTLYISRVRFEDNTFWQDNGSHACSLSNKAK